MYLFSDMSKYECCQGYIQCCCFKGGACGENSCPELCLCLEATFCLGLSMSTSRMYIMDKYQLAYDPCDNRLIRLNNCCEFIYFYVFYFYLLYVKLITCIFETI